MAVTFGERASGVLLTTGDIDTWRVEIDRLMKERDAIEAQIGDLEERIETANYFLKLTQPKPAEDEKAPEADVPLTDFILKIFERERKALLPHVIRAYINRDAFQAERMKKNPNYFHTAMKRLRDRGLVIRAGDTYRLPPKENEPQAVFPLEAQTPR